MANLHPLYDNVVLQRVARPEKTESGLIMPETHDDGSNLGLVVAVGGAESTRTDH